MEIINRLWGKDFRFLVHIYQIYQEKTVKNVKEQLTIKNITMQ